MILFILSFFLIYGSLHLYAFLKARAALAFGLRAGLPLGLFMLLMVLAPLLIRMLERRETMARIMSYIGYTWFGLLFLFFCSSLLIDFYRLTLYAGGLLLKKNFTGPSPQVSFFAPLAVSILICFYGFFEARDIRTEHVTVRTSKLSGLERLRVVQISDVHVGLIVRGERLGRILRAAREAEPDMLISTGDLVDGQMDALKGVAEMFQAIRPRYGKYAITGNHEFYAGLGHAVDFTEQAGFRMLRGESVSELINIAGVDDPQGRTFNTYKDVPERELLSGLPRDKFTLLLKHRPATDKDSLGLYDLQLSGHTHKGQIFPFSLVTRLYYPVHAGCLSLVDGSRLYVSRGSGTWGPPIRFLAPPEVTVIDIVGEGS